MHKQQTPELKIFRHSSFKSVVRHTSIQLLNCFTNHGFTVVTLPPFLPFLSLLENTPAEVRGWQEEMQLHSLPGRPDQEPTCHDVVTQCKHPKLPNKPNSPQTQTARVVKDIITLVYKYTHPGIQIYADL